MIIRNIRLLNNIFVLAFYKGEEWEIMRGTWYYDGSWIPLEMEHSKTVEQVHLSLFETKPLKQSKSASELNTTPSHSYKGRIIDAYIDLTSNDH